MKKILIYLLIIGTIILNTENVSAKTTLNCTKTLRTGSKSEQVKILQKELNEVMNCNLKVDGKFGSATKSCILAFQKNNSLLQDAIVGKKTCTKLNTLYLLSNEDEENSDESDSSNSLFKTTNTLVQGSSGSEVVTLQETLNKKIHCNLDIDGVFGYKTKWCVKKYQEENNLSVDGKVGPLTKNSLNETVNKTDNSKYVIIAKTSNRKLRVRQGASTSTKHIGDVYTSEIYKVRNSKVVDGTTWYKIEYQDGKYGYISGNYATMNFILLDISNQTIKLYRNGRTILTAPTVTGNISKGYDTPLGVYKVGTSLSYETQGRRIHLSKYDAYVDYWMPFIGGSYGFHDADWRSLSQMTTGKTYLTNGSHGCVNMLREDAKYLYDNIYKGLAVHIVE